MTPKTPKNHYEVAIVGGGINGAGIARECALRGISCILLEKDDFASGTSSKSSKLAHGGLRYLEHGDIRLVFEACHERERLLANAPHLVKSLPFIIPIYTSSRRPKWQIKMGLWLYDKLSGFSTVRPHKMLSKKDVIDLEPGLNQEGLVGGAMYYDAQMDDARLVIETVLEAEKYGSHVYNYMKVDSVKNTTDTPSTLSLTDTLTHTSHTITANLIINTTGPWSDTFMSKVDSDHIPQLRLSKGVHIITKSDITSHAILLTSDKDGRVFFVIPWFGLTMIGTTDTDYNGNLDTIDITEDDITYLLESAKTHVPGLSLKKQDIISTFAGLRPLIKQTSGTASQVSREHKISQTGAIISLFGGKYTTFRKMSEDVAKHIHSQLRKGTFHSLTEALPHWGGKIKNIDTFIQENADFDTKTYGISNKTYAHLVRLYGSKYSAVLDHALLFPDGLDTLGNTQHIKGEVYYARDIEKAKTLTDFLRRRTRLALSSSSDISSISNIFSNDKLNGCVSR